MPEQRLIAAMIRQAIADARSGDDMACHWLIHDAPEWLTWLVEDDTDVALMHSRIMRHAGVERLTADAI